MATESKQFDWVPFYKEFAEKLSVYKNNRKDLIQIVYDVYSTTGIKMPTMEKDNILEDIDPFTVYAIFTKGLAANNRNKIITYFHDRFQMKSPIPQDFSGIPFAQNQNATYYSFKDKRQKDDIDDIWNTFEVALNYAKEQTEENRKAFCSAFDIANNIKGIGNSKLTMALFWIAPDFYLSVDGRSRWYLCEGGVVPTSVTTRLLDSKNTLTGEEYLSLKDRVTEYLNKPDTPHHSFVELSADAYSLANKVNEEQKEQEKDEQKQQKEEGLADQDVRTTHYWIYAPGIGACKWEAFYKKGIMGIGWKELGDLSEYKSRKDMVSKMKEVYDPNKTYIMDSLATWQFAYDMRPGDVIFVKKGLHQLIGRGVVESDYRYDEEESDYPNIRKVRWTHNGTWPHPGQAVMKSLTDITQYTEYVNDLNHLFESEETESEVDEDTEVEYPSYTKEDFLSDVFMEEKNYEQLVKLLLKKKNVILQGAPGVGKTYVAKRLAYSLLGRKDQDKVMMVQFHQSYSYEDFIEGFRPNENGGFEIKKGSFYKFCKTAANDSENKYFFIIDEINRGNLSKIFGELFMLIETDKRGNELQLLYSDEKFAVPSNLYIIGMMNTADRSLAMLDYALRRRFAFYDMRPAFTTPKFLSYVDSKHNPHFTVLITQINALNEAIKADSALGDGFCIGHSFFSNLNEITDDALSDIIDYEILPLLREYWFDEPDKVRMWSDNLKGALR